MVSSIKKQNQKTNKKTPNPNTPQKSIKTKEINNNKNNPNENNPLSTELHHVKAQLWNSSWVSCPYKISVQYLMQECFDWEIYETQRLDNDGVKTHSARDL